MECSHPYTSVVAMQYQIVGYIQGNIVKTKDGMVEKNPIWVVNVDGKEVLLMYVEPNILCNLCREYYNKLIEFENKNNNSVKLSWTKKDDLRKYIRTNYHGTTLYIHQAIMDWHGHGSGTGGLSVDHIDRDPLNNTLDNLRIATSAEQHQNTKGVLPNTKKERRSDAKELPEGITTQDIPKYITYNTHKYGTNNEFSREFFRIEGHPLLPHGTAWCSTTKNSVSIQDKLQQAKTALNYLHAHHTLPEKPQRDLPQYVSYFVERGHHILAWQKHGDEARLSKKITIETDYHDLSKEQQDDVLNRLNREVVKKYDNKYAIFELDATTLNKIMKEKEDALPMYVRTQEFADGLYLVFNKSKGDNRISLTRKLPANYQINRELHIFNTKIVEKYGIDHAIILDKFPYVPSSDIIELPEEVYASLKCKKPYLILKKDNDTYSWPLPERYDLMEQVRLLQTQEHPMKDEERTIDEYKQLFTEGGMKPDNISICLKDKR